MILSTNIIQYCRLFQQLLFIVADSSVQHLFEKPVQDSSGAAPSVFAKIDGAAGSAAASAPARKSERRENFAVMAKSLRSSLWECFGILSTIGGPRGGANSDRTRPNSQKMKNVFRPNDVMV